MTTKKTYLIQRNTGGVWIPVSFGIKSLDIAKRDAKPGERILEVKPDRRYGKVAYVIMVKEGK